MATQRQLRQNVINSPRNRKHRYLLSGRIRCGCGWSMRGLTAPPRYVYYRCRRSDKEFGPGRCEAGSVRAREVESLVWGEIGKALSSPEAIWGALQRRQRLSSQIGLKATPRGQEGDRKAEEARAELNLSLPCW